VCGTQRARTHTASLVPSPRLRYPTCTACMVRSVLYENTCRGRCELTPPRAPPLPRAVRLRHRPLMPGTCGRSQPRTPHRWRGRGNGVGGKPSVARRGAAPPPCTHRVSEKKSGSGSQVCPPRQVCVCVCVCVCCSNAYAAATSAHHLPPPPVDLSHRRSAQGRPLPPPYSSTGDGLLKRSAVSALKRSAER
jgi:hypothetical protein